MISTQVQMQGYKACKKPLCTYIREDGCVSDWHLTWEGPPVGSAFVSHWEVRLTGELALLCNSGMGDLLLPKT